MQKNKTVATPIDQRPICSRCKSNKADIVENNTFFCAFCKIMDLPRHVRKKIEEPDQSPRKLHGNLGKKYVARKNKKTCNVRRKNK
jgi:hypothetical protein